MSDTKTPQNLNSGRDTNRVSLHKVIPLSMPYKLTVSPGEVCNFRCNYCMHGNPKIKIKNNFNISLETFIKLCSGITNFEQKIKVFLIQGIGEPLANPQIADMYKYISDLGIAERLELTSNGSLLTHKKSLELIDSGITRIIISLQGINAEAYKRTAGINIDFGKFYDNLCYLFENRKNCKIHLKAVDTALSEGEEEKFFDLFSKISDTINIDRTLPLFQGINYDNKVKSRIETNIQGVQNKVKTCPVVFYMMYVYPDGNVLACCDYNGPVIGNVFETPLNKIWNGDKHKALMKCLMRDETIPPYCITCTQKYGQTMPEDDIEAYREEIYARI